MRERLVRATETDYQVVRSNDNWPDHRARTLVTAALIAWLRPDSVLDPACGDASIVIAADRVFPIHRAYVADISQPNVDRISHSASLRAVCADISTAMDEFPKADVIVLTEILEHLPDPDRILSFAKEKARYLIASSPEMRPGQVDGNPEHLWQFDREGYRRLLTDAGWEVVQYTHLSFTSEYDFGVWVCR